MKKKYAIFEVSNERSFGSTTQITLTQVGEPHNIDTQAEDALKKIMKEHEGILSTPPTWMILPVYEVATPGE